MYGRANAHINKTFFTSSLLSVISIVNSAFGIENTFFILLITPFLYTFAAVIL